jgi:hypothetical protein
MTTPLSFAAFKKLLQVGTLIRVTNFAHDDISGERPVTRVKGNAIASRAVRKSTSEVIDESWHYWPSAAHVKCEVIDGVPTYLTSERSGEVTTSPWMMIEVIG